MIKIAPMTKRPGNRLRNEPAEKAEPAEPKDDSNEPSALYFMIEAVNLEIRS